MKPRDYQAEAISSIMTAIETHRTVGVVMPTGSGKTLVETEIIDSFISRLRFNEAIVVLSHLTDVVNQVHQFYVTNGNHPKRSLRMSYKARERPRLSTQVIFATIQSMCSARGDDYWTLNPMRKSPKLLIVDEAHLWGTDSYDKMNDLIGPDCKVIGFSATPYRNNQYSFGQFEHVAYAIDTQTLIDQGYLTPPRLFEMDMSDMGEPERMASIIRIWRERERQRGLVSVAYFPVIRMAQEMRLIAEQEGIKAEFVSGESSDTFCRELFARARRGEVELIVNARKLETGIDIPNIGSIFMPWPVGSVTTYLQRIGRALRPCPGKDFAHIYVFGSAPSIKSGLWRKIHMDALRAKDPLDPISNLEDDLQSMEESGRSEERIAWTRTEIEACHMLLSLDQRAVAELIAEKKFPAKYSRAIRDIVKRYQPPTESASKIPLSDSEVWALTHQHLMREDDVRKLSGGDGRALLGALNSFMSRDPYIIQLGPHAGRHIGDTPPLYRRHMKAPENVALWRRWIKAGKPEERK